MPGKTQNKQLALAIEAVQGTPETITASDLVTALNVQPTINPNLQTRPVNRGTFSKLAATTGILDGGVTFEQEFAGPASGSASDKPPIGRTLQACGYREIEVYAVTINTLAGGIGAGDIIAVGTPSPTAFRGRVLATTLVQDFQNGDTTLFYELLTPGSNITPTDTGMVADNTALSPSTRSVLSAAITPAIGLSSQTGTAVGWAYQPTSTRSNSIAVTQNSGSFSVGDVIEQTISTSPEVKAYGRVVEDLSAASGTLIYQQYDGSAPFQTTGGSVTSITVVGGGGDYDATADGIQYEGITLTAKTFEDGKSKRFGGCTGNAVIDLVTGGYPKANVTLQGGIASSDVIDEANLTAGADAAGAVQPFRNIRFDFDRVWSLCTANIQIDLQNSLAQRVCATAPSGSEGYSINDRRPLMTCDPEMVQELVFASDAKMLAGDTFRMKMEWGSGTMNRWRIVADVLQYQQNDTADREGFITTDSQIQINDLATRSDSEMTIINY